MVINGYGIPLILGLLPSVSWLLFFLLEDRLHPEPKKMIIKVFTAGMLAAITATVFQLIFRNAFLLKSLLSAISPLPLITLALAEELIKFLAVYTAVKGSKYLDEPVDYMIYMITGALGFAAVENFLFLIQKQPEIILEITILRAISATLLHPLASGFIGFYWAKKRMVLGLFIATLLHAAFNYLIIKFSLFPMSAIVILIVASFFLFYDFDIIKEDD